MKTTVTEISDEIFTDTSVVTNDLDDNSDPTWQQSQSKRSFESRAAKKF